MLTNHEVQIQILVAALAEIRNRTGNWESGQDADLLMEEIHETAIDALQDIKQVEIPNTASAQTCG